MSNKESISVFIHSITWDIYPLGKQVYLLQSSSEIEIEKVHQTSTLIEEILGDELEDIVPAFDSIALFTKLSIDDLLHMATVSKKSIGFITPAIKKVEIPICYELGQDLELVADHAGLSIDVLIQLHLSGTYRSLFFGFTPGFVYADGLSPQLQCPRKEVPRRHIEAGSVAIGGSQTGIYSLDSPGGWNVIGRTPIRLFNPTNNPPMKISVGSFFFFRRISRKEFEQWEN